MEEKKKEDIQRYIQWAQEQPEFKEKLKKAIEIYTIYYTKDPNGVRKTMEQLEKEYA